MEEHYIPTAPSVLSKGFASCEVEKSSPGNQVTGITEGAGLAEGLHTALLSSHWLQPSSPGKLTLKLPYCKHHVSLECFWCTNTKSMVTKHSMHLSRLLSHFSCCSCRCFSSHLSFSDLLISVITSLSSWFLFLSQPFSLVSYLSLNPSPLQGEKACFTHFSFLKKSHF